MHSHSKKVKKATLLLILACSSQVIAMTSTMSHRVMGTSPLLYRMMDYSKHQTCFEIEPIFSSMYDPSHVNQNIMLHGQSSIILDQQGAGDMNPVWINLMSNNTEANYRSTVSFTPILSLSGALFHTYNQFDNNLFFDVKTALVQCKSEIKINEVGGGNGLLGSIMNAQQAFTQVDWNYGKIGQLNHVVGLDNIELRLGKATESKSNASSYDMLIAGFLVIEAPTGTGTKAEWLFEPQVGTNHWGLGFGFEALVSGDDDLKFMIAGNYRYLMPAWETRSFDLIGNGQWSRYLSLQDTYGLPTAPATFGLPGINFLTQQAYINGRSELNLYTRLQKQFKSSYFELSYNLFCLQKESIGAIKAMPTGYGIFALTGPDGGPGGVTTANSARINQDTPLLDPIDSPETLSSDRFNKFSACAGTYATNTLAARLEIQRNNMIYGFGANIEAALSAAAISTWSVWAQFGFLFDSVQSSDCDHEFSPELFNLDPITGESIHHQMNMDHAKLPQDVITAIEDEFLDDKDNFEFLDEDDFNFNEEIDNLQKNLITNEISQLKEQLLFQEEEKNKEIDALEQIIKDNLEEQAIMTLDTSAMDSSISDDINLDTDIISIENIAENETASSSDETQAENTNESTQEPQPSSNTQLSTENTSIPFETISPTDTDQPTMQDNIIPVESMSVNEITKPTTENTSESLETEITQPIVEETKQVAESAPQENVEPVIQPVENQTIPVMNADISQDKTIEIKNNSEEIKENLTPTLEITPDQLIIKEDEKENKKLNLKTYTQPLSEKEILEKLDSKK